jgi:hypothetical protein
MSVLDTLRPALGSDVDWPHPGGHLGSAEIVPMVETVLRAAMERLDAEAAAAHAEASAAVAAAVRRSADLVLASANGRLRSRDDDLVLVGPSRLPEPADDQLGPEVSTRTQAQVYDLFWSEIPADQPIRERLRRWAQRPAQ